MTLPLRLRLSGKKLFLGCTLAALQLVPANVARANPTAEQALSLAPIQKEVEYDKPATADIGKCTIEVEKIDGRVGWVVKDPQGTVIRRFIDTNGDNTVDQWSYYEGGLEVYRDLDTNANGKADQCRWLNTAGSRWGVDADENGVIDSWKQISAEEVSAEAVGAMAARDSARFQRLLLTTDELKTLGVGEKFSGVISDKVSSASKRFSGLVTDAKFANVAQVATKWINFSGTRPGIVPAGTEGTTKDLLVYENVAAMMEINGKTSQVQIGTMLRIGDTWRLIDVPTPVTDEKEIAAGTLFFTPTINGTTGTAGTGGTPTGEGDFAGIEELNKQIEQAVTAGDAAKVKSLKAQKVAKIEGVIPGLKAEEDRLLWTRQLIDAMAEGISERTNPEFLDELKRIEKKIAGGTESELATYAQFSALRADYIRQANAPGANGFEKVHQAWLQGLTDFAKANPKAPETAEALLHLAIDADFRDDEKVAIEHYKTITANFPQSNDAKKAAGAISRLQSVGKVMPLQGTTSDGKPFNIAAYTGKTIIVHYWDSQNPANVGELAMLKAVQAKFAKDGVMVLGVSLDRDQKVLTTFLQQAQLPWITLWEQGGMDGRFANEMGILTVPTIMIVDKSGKVANRGLHISQLDTELGTLLRK
jgi:peroxiredoxin